MPPLPYPHRVSFLASALLLPASIASQGLLAAKTLAAVLFDHLLRHPVVTVGDFDDERLTDDDNRLLDPRHPDIEETVDWFFRVNRRHEVLWLELSLDPDRPQPTRVRARRPTGPIEDWTATGGDLSAQIARCLDQWADARRLPRIGALTPFTASDLRDVVQRLDRALVAARPTDHVPDPEIPAELLVAPARLGVAFYRVLGDMSPLPHRDLDLAVLGLEPDHPVARRNDYLYRLRHEKGDRRAILPLVAEAPMFGKPHLSIWGEAFEDRPDEGMGLRHQGIAASLLPANPYACHNYSLQLNDAFRREESYRWSDRATIGSPSFNNAHLDCVRRLRQVGRPGQAFAEAQYRCNDILDRWSQGQITPFEWPAKYHAGMLLAFTHFDVGRLDEGIRLAESTLADLEDPEAGHESFGWAAKRLRDWKHDSRVLAQAYAWEGYHRGDPGRTLTGFARSRVDDADDVAMLLEALIAIGREDLARVAFHHHAGVDGVGIIGDGKARLLGAKLEILLGDPFRAIELLQTVQLRRSQSRLEAEINRVLRLACVRKPVEWDAVIGRRLEQGARRLARMAARDLADFVPGLDTDMVQAALGERRRFDIEPVWLAMLRAALPGLGIHADNIDRRLVVPGDHTLAAADQLAQEWWTVLVPPAKDRDGHAATAVYALGVSLARYLALSSGPPSPVSGAYRHIATEALHLVRRARYQIDERGARGLLELLDRCAERMAPGDDWLLDTWLLRIERALDLDTELGSFLPGLVAGLPRIGGLLRGDERIAWELRTAFDLREDPSQHEPARYLLERCQRGLETGAASVILSDIAAASLPVEEAIDVHWLAAIANPFHGGAWVNLARAQLALGQPDEAFEALCRGLAPTGDEWRKAALASLEPAWTIDVPFGFDRAQGRGLEALGRGDLDTALRCMRWCEAQDPANTAIKRNLGIILAKLGHIHDAVRAMAGHDRTHAARLVGHAALEAHRYEEAVLAYRYAALGFTTADDWRLLAAAAWYAEDDDVAAVAYQKMLDAGAPADGETLNALATALYSTGQWQKCEPVARRLIQIAGDEPLYRSCGLHALARALCGLGRFAEALPVAQDAAQLNPVPDSASEMAETLTCAQTGAVPPFKTGAEAGIERRAYDALATSDFATPESLASQGNSWALFRAALAATEFRTEADNNHPVTARALEAALMVLDRSAGNPLADAALCRMRALRIRENAFIQIDPPPPLGTRLTPEEFEQQLAARRRALAAKPSTVPPLAPSQASARTAAPTIPPPPPSTAR